MFIPVLSGLIVSLDAFFIGLSLGLQKRCRFLYLIIINIFLISLCFIGYLVAEPIDELFKFDSDIIVGISFITLGLWWIFQCFISEYYKRNKTKPSKPKTFLKTIILVGLVMSIEAMFITIGITIIFIENTSILIPITIGLAHFGYSTISFYLARMKYLKNMPCVITNVISGCALIVYGLLALFIEFGV